MGRREDGDTGQVSERKNRREYVKICKEGPHRRLGGRVGKWGGASSEKGQMR